MSYNYREAVREDVLNYIREEVNFSDYESIEELESALNEELWAADSVTGNGSGSYTFNAWKAEENLSHNWDLIEEAAEAFGIEPTISSSWDHGAEWWDVTIRCYLLPETITEALEEVAEEFEEAHAETEE